MGKIAHADIGTSLTQTEFEADTTHTIGGTAGLEIVRSATLIVAASDATANCIAQADYVCDGTSDEVQIIAAIAALSTAGGSIQFSEGTYVKGNTTSIKVPSNVSLILSAGATITYVTDVGDGAIIFENDDTTDGNTGIAITGDGVLDGNKANQATGTQSAIKFTKVSGSRVDCHIRNFTYENLWEVEPRGGNVYKNADFPNTLDAENVASIVSSHPLVEVLDDFEANWTAGVGTITYDTTIFHNGSRSCKMVSVLGGNADIQKVISSTDMSNKGLILWLYTPDYTKINRLLVYLGSGGGFGNSSSGKFIDGHASDGHGISSKWWRVEVPYYPDEIVGNIDFTAVNIISIKLIAEAGEVATVYVDSLSTVKKSWSNGGVVTFSFDDGYESTYDNAKPLFDVYGYGAVLGTITDAIGITAGRLNLNELKKMQECGWDISSHSKTHSYDLDSHAEAEEELLGSQSWLLENGFPKGARFYILPGDLCNANMMDILEEHYIFTRAGTSSYSMIPGGTFINIVALNSGYSIANITAAIDTAMANNTWLNLTLHQVGTAGESVLTATLEAVIDYCHDNGVPVLTFSQVWDRLVSPVEVVQCSDIFMDVLAVSATAIRSNEDLSEAIPNTFTLSAQPDVPRTLSGHFDSHAQITAYTIVVTGVDAKANTVTDTLTEADGWDWETDNAYATVTSIIMTARTGTGAGDTMDIGITDVLGLSNAIYEIGDIYKIKKNNANATVAGAQINTLYDTYDMAVIGLAATDDFTIWYKSSLNIVS